MYLFYKHIIHLLYNLFFDLPGRCVNFWCPYELRYFILFKSCKAHHRKVAKLRTKPSTLFLCPNFCPDTIPPGVGSPGVPLRDFSKSGRQLVFNFLIFMGITNGLFQRWTELHFHQWGLFESSLTQTGIFLISFWEVICVFCFNLYFPDYSWVLAYFHKLMHYFISVSCWSIVYFLMGYLSFCGWFVAVLHIIQILML